MYVKQCVGLLIAAALSGDFSGVRNGKMHLERIVEKFILTCNTQMSSYV